MFYNITHRLSNPDFKTSHDVSIPVMQFGAQKCVKKCVRDAFSTLVMKCVSETHFLISLVFLAGERCPHCLPRVQRNSVLRINSRKRKS